MKNEEVLRRTKHLGILKRVVAQFMVLVILSTFGQLAVCQIGKEFSCSEAKRQGADPSFGTVFLGWPAVRTQLI